MDVQCRYLESICDSLGDISCDERQSQWIKDGLELYKVAICIALIPVELVLGDW
jgi:hypothetical protein